MKWQEIKLIVGIEDYGVGGITALDSVLSALTNFTEDEITLDSYDAIDLEFAPVEQTPRQSESIETKLESMSEQLQKFLESTEFAAADTELLANFNNLAEDIKLRAQKLQNDANVSILQIAEERGQGHPITKGGNCN